MSACSRPENKSSVCWFWTDVQVLFSSAGPLQKFTTKKYLEHSWRISNEVCLWGEIVNDTVWEILEMTGPSVTWTPPQDSFTEKHDVVTRGKEPDCSRQRHYVLMCLCVNEASDRNQPITSQCSSFDSDAEVKQAVNGAASGEWRTHSLRLLPRLMGDESGPERRSSPWGTALQGEEGGQVETQAGHKETGSTTETQERYRTVWNTRTGKTSWKGQTRLVSS